MSQSQADEQAVSTTGPSSLPRKKGSRESNIMDIDETNVALQSALLVKHVLDVCTETLEEVLRFTSSIQHAVGKAIEEDGSEVTCKRMKGILDVFEIHWQGFHLDRMRKVQNQLVEATAKANNHAAPIGNDGQTEIAQNAKNNENTVAQNSDEPNGQEQNSEDSDAEGQPSDGCDSPTQNNDAAEASLNTSENVDNVARRECAEACETEEAGKEGISEQAAIQQRKDALQSWHVPFDFEFPTVNLEEGWRLWWLGMPEHKEVFVENGVAKSVPAPIRPFRLINRKLIPNPTAQSMHRLRWEGIFKLMEQAPALKVPDKAEDINEAFVRESFLVARDYLKNDRMSYVYKNPSSKPDAWTLSTWSKFACRSSIVKYGTDSDKANMPPPNPWNNRRVQRTPRLRKKKDKVTGKTKDKGKVTGISATNKEIGESEMKE